MLEGHTGASTRAGHAVADYAISQKTSGSCSKCNSVTIPVLHIESSTSRKSSLTAIGSSGMNSKTESFRHLFEQNQSESPNDINKIKVSDLGSDLEKIAIDSDFERERSGKMRTLASAGIATLGG